MWSVCKPRGHSKYKVLGGQKIYGYQIRMLAYARGVSFGNISSQYKNLLVFISNGGFSKGTIINSKKYINYQKVGAKAMQPLGSATHVIPKHIGITSGYHISKNYTLGV